MREKEGQEKEDAWNAKEHKLQAGRLVLEAASRSSDGNGLSEETCEEAKESDSDKDTCPSVAAIKNSRLQSTAVWQSPKPLRGKLSSLKSLLSSKNSTSSSVVKQIS